ncbi:uncharacterized protein [Engystomops pustulosus]|uniref:uncharacterized protein isoform X2 n=1 Tax=Engystomops pustulosus TaxID=76066 RepID=UPI003AFB4EF1
MEELKKQKLYLQKQIDCMYMLKAANPGKQALLNNKLDSLAKQLSDVVREMEATIEQMGPVGETFRNQQRFEGDQASTSRSETPQPHVRPILQPATLPFEEGEVYKKRQQPSTAAATRKVLQVPAVPNEVLQVPAVRPDISSEVEEPQVPGGSALQEDSGREGLPMGDVPLDGISVADLGPVVVTILKSPAHYNGKDIGLSAGKLTGEEYAEIISTVTKQMVKDAKLLPDDYEAGGGPHGMANMFRFYMMSPNRDVELTHKLNPKIRNFQQWMEENKAAFKC